MAWQCQSKKNEMEQVNIFSGGVSHYFLMKHFIKLTFLSIFITIIIIYVFVFWCKLNHAQYKN